MEKTLIQGLEDFLNQDAQVITLKCGCVGRCTCGNVAYPDYGVIRVLED